ncbi:unnamed protein product [Caenorhabditis angaria]|uniref:Serpentine receptor class r-10 n=1 Tax=Caenorhabditis angaria TaxID=860376 RepID=A0A9P1MW77_9PELO|nr:unnamed protein product [Caenorhabditis angaria]
MSNFVQNRIQDISATISVLLNIILIFLILTKSPKKLGSYKYLMLYISLFEILYSILDVVVSPVIISKGSACLVISYIKNSMLSQTINIVLHTSYCGSFGTSMGIFALHFIYRYLTATGSKYISTFESWKMICWMLIPITYGIIWGLIGYTFIGPNAYTNDFMKNDIEYVFGWDIRDTIYIGPHFYKTDSLNFTWIDKNAFIAAGGMCIILLSSIITILYFGVKCYKSINNMVKDRVSTSSSNFKNVQTQLFYALVIQTIIPVLFLHIPVSVIFICTFLELNIGLFGGIVTISIALFPAIDPLPTMFIIKIYRDAIIGYVRSFLHYTKIFPNKNCAIQSISNHPKDISTPNS